MRGARALVLVLFFLSGASGLVYEIAWTRQLGLLFGVSVFATSAVLAAFMGGLGLGSFLFGRLIPTRSNPLRAYAWLEAGIAVSALAVGPALAAAEPLYVALARMLEGNYLLFSLARALLAILVLLVPTTLMGGTVPAIAGVLVNRRDEVGWSTGLLYAANTSGAFVGCIAAGFALVHWLGLSAAVRVAVVVNLGISAVILLGGVGSRAERAPRPPPPTGTSHRRPAAPRSSSPWPYSRSRASPPWASRCSGHAPWCSTSTTRTTPSP